MNRLLLPVLFLVLCQSLYGQKFSTKFGQVSKGDLELERCPIDPQSGAMVLSDITEAQIVYPRAGSALEVVLMRHVRIKIFNSTGFDQADVQIPYYTGTQNQSVISKIKAQTIVPKDKGYDKIEVDKSKFYYEQTNDYYSSVKFSFPQVDEGVLLEYEYRLSTKYLSTIKEWNLQGRIPIRYVYYEATIPEFLDCSVSVTGHDSERISFDKSDNLQSQYSFSNIAYAFEGHNMPGLEQDAYGTSLENFRTKARVIIRSLDIPGEPIKTISGDYYHFNDNLFETSEFNQLNQSAKYLETAVAEVKRSDDPREDMGRFVMYVQKKVTYNQERYFFPDKNARSTLNGSPVNSGSINMLLVLLLNQAGYTAEPVILGSRLYRRPHPFYPDFNDFDHMVVLVTLEGKMYVLDATSGLPDGKPRVDVFNGEGWVVSKSNPRKIDLHSLSEAHLYVKSFWDLNPGSRTGVTCELNCNYIGVFALTGREGYTSNALNTQLRSNVEGTVDSLYLDEGDKNISATIVGSVDIPDKPVLYLQPWYFKLLDYEVFRKEERSTPIEFPYLISATQIIELKIPSGYVVESLPPSQKLTLENDGMRVSYIADANDDLIRINLRFSIKEEFYLVEQYQQVRSFLSEVESLMNKKIVLKHAE